jgi:hypothetical protein
MVVGVKETTQMRVVLMMMKKIEKKVSITVILAIGDYVDVVLKKIVMIEKRLL